MYTVRVYGQNGRLLEITGQLIEGNDIELLEVLDVLSGIELTSREEDFERIKRQFITEVIDSGEMQEVA